jgi:excisionase family DNA binding protein
LTAPPPAQPSKRSGAGSLIDVLDARSRSNRSRVVNEVPRLALSKAEAAEALGVSVDFFEEHVMPELRVVRRGRRRLIPTGELMRWLDANAHRTWAA